MFYVPMLHGYWNCIVWAVRRLMPNVINPTFAEYEPFEKHAFPLLQPVEPNLTDYLLWRRKDGNDL